MRSDELRLIAQIQDRMSKLSLEGLRYVKAGLEKAVTEAIGKDNGGDK